MATLEHLPGLEDALNLFLGKDFIVIGDLNMVIERLKNPRIQQVADFLVYFGLVDILNHFIQQLRFCHIKTW